MSSTPIPQRTLEAMTLGQILALVSGMTIQEQVTMRGWLREKYHYDIGPLVAPRSWNDYLELGNAFTAGIIIGAAAAKFGYACLYAKATAGKQLLIYKVECDLGGAAGAVFLSLDDAVNGATLGALGAFPTPNFLLFDGFNGPGPKSLGAVTPNPAASQSLNGGANNNLNSTGTWIGTRFCTAAESKQVVFGDPTMERPFCMLRPANQASAANFAGGICASAGVVNTPINAMFYYAEIDAPPF